MNKISSWLPTDSKRTILEQVHQIDITLSAYIRGQTNVCLLLGIFYALALNLAGLDFGFTIGLLTGLLSFIPYVGVLFGFTIGVIIAFLQFDSWVNISIIAAIFLVGQFIEGTFVTPKLVGDKVGLHPVWIIFSLMVGGTILGFVGILIAIPVASVLKVLIKFFFNKYLDSDLYAPKGNLNIKTKLSNS
jgi:predicted PurR-regulated permease PerM